MRDQTARQKGTIVTFDDSYLILHIYANFFLISAVSVSCRRGGVDSNSITDVRSTVFDNMNQSSEGVSILMITLFLQRTHLSGLFKSLCGGRRRTISILPI